jgi:2-C-methyl-D-erythritol 4-phosphate cytidylyltransferase
MLFTSVCRISKTLPMPCDACDPREVTALILAGGEGRRMGGTPKAFVEFQKRTLIARTIAMVSPWADRVVIGVREEDVPRAQEVVAKLPEAKRIICVAGGPTRQDTLRRVLDRAETRYVLLHEVARACTSSADFRGVLTAVCTHPAVVLYSKVQVRDSVALLEGEKLGAILPRKTMIALQTPHAYEHRALLAAYALAERDGVLEESTAALVQRSGTTIHLVESAGGNFKMTYPDDLRKIGSRKKLARAPGK